MTSNRSLINPLLVIALTAGFSLIASAETGVSEKKILIGKSRNRAGQNAERSGSFELGEDLYINEVNRTGGVKGRKIEALVYDDSYDPKRAAENTVKLIENDKVFALTTYYGTATSKAALKAVDESKIPFLFPVSDAESFRQPPIRNVFPFRGGFGVSMATAVDFLVKKHKVKSIGAIYQSDAFGTEGSQALISAIEKKRTATIKASSAPYQRGTTDIDEAYAKISATKPDCIFLISQSAAGIAFLRKASQNGYKPIVFTISTNLDPDFFKEVGKLNFEVYAVQGFPFLDSKLPILEQYRQAAKKAGQDVSLAAAEGYAMMKLFVELLQRAPEPLTRADLVKSIESTSQMDLGGIGISFSSTDHEAIGQGYLGKVTASGVVSISEN